MSEPKGRGPAWTEERRRSHEGRRDLKSAPEASEWPLGTVTVLGAHILDVLGRPVETIPPGQGSVRLREIRATAAGTAAGTAVDLAKLGARVLAAGAIGEDLLGDIVIAAMARHGVDTTGLVRKQEAQTSATILPIRPNGERPALHVPGATRLFTRADVDLAPIRASRALLIGAPDALAGLTGGELADIAAAAKASGALVAVDVLHPGRPQDFDRLAPLLATTDWFMPNGDQILALTGREELTDAIKDVLALGTAAVAVTCGALVATGLGSDAGIENLGQVLDFLSGTQPAVAGRIKEHMS